MTATYHKEGSPGAPRITMNDAGPGTNTEQLIAGLKEREVPYEHIDGSIQIVLDPDTFSTHEDFIQRVLGGFTYQAEAPALGVGEKPVVDDLSYVFRSVSSKSSLKAFYQLKQESLSADPAAGGAAGASVGGGG